MTCAQPRPPDTAVGRIGRQDSTLIIKTTLAIVVKVSIVHLRALRRFLCFFIPPSYVDLSTAQTTLVTLL